MADTKPPKHLSLEARRLFRSVAASFDLEPHHVVVLTLACEALDRMRQAQEAVRRDGAFVEGRFGPRPHPGIGVERDARVALLRALRELGLDIEETSGRQRTAKARAARW